jgi:EmrB/QacA subfamily drug resistance transporter
MRLTSVRAPAQEWVVATAFVTALFMSIMDSTIVTVALPSIARDLGASIASTGWVVVGYLLSLAVWIPATGWIGDRFGTKRTFLSALALFAVASALCGLATTLDQLIAFRVLQGIGGGLLLPVGTAMLFRAFPPERRAQAASIVIVPTTVAPALGPILGGVLVETVGWPGIFYVNVPIAAVTLVFGWLYLDEHREAQARRFDAVGFVLSATAFPLVLFALVRAADLGWTSPVVLAAGGLGLLLGTALVWAELRRADPLLDLRLLGERLFGLVNLASFFGFGSYIGLLYLMPLFLQEAHRASPLESGLTTFPEAIGVILSSRVVARLYPRLGPRRLIAGGLVGTAAAMGLCALIDDQTDLWLVRGLMFGAGVAMANVFLSINAAAFARIAHADMGHASAIFNAQRRLAAAAVVAVLATVLASIAPALGAAGAHAGDLVPAFRVVFAINATMALVGAIAALAIRDVDAADTMAREPG